MKRWKTSKNLCPWFITLQQFTYLMPRSSDLEPSLQFCCRQIMAQLLCLDSLRPQRTSFSPFYYRVSNDQSTYKTQVINNIYVYIIKSIDLSLPIQVYISFCQVSSHLYCSHIYKSGASPLKSKHFSLCLSPKRSFVLWCSFRLT